MTNLDLYLLARCTRPEPVESEAADLFFAGLGVVCAVSAALLAVLS